MTYPNYSLRKMQKLFILITDLQLFRKNSGRVYLFARSAAPSPAAELPVPFMVPGIRPAK